MTIEIKKPNVDFSTIRSVHLEIEEALTSDKPAAYALTTNGVVKIVQTELGTFIHKTNEVPGLASVKEGYYPKLPKIPFEIYKMIVSFFRDVARTTNEAEALVQIFWDREKQEYFAHVPKQIVSKSSVRYTPSEELLAQHLIVMDIHSHNTMDAFWSGTDDTDEQAYRLFGVIGHVFKDKPNSKFRYGAGGGDANKDMEFSDVFEEDVEVINYPKDTWFKALTHVTTVVQTTSLGTSSYPHSTGGVTGIGVGARASLEDEDVYSGYSGYGAGFGFSRAGSGPAAATPKDEHAVTRLHTHWLASLADAVCKVTISGILTSELPPSVVKMLGITTENIKSEKDLKEVLFGAITGEQDDIKFLANSVRNIVVSPN